VGKTTLLLQYIREKNDKATLYVSADDIYFSRYRLSDLANEFYKNGGKQLFVDEIHKYKDWATELKNSYDFYQPDLLPVGERAGNRKCSRNLFSEPNEGKPIACIIGCC
jgi:predicted AAA+ superfamily ATPase